MTTRHPLWIAQRHGQDWRDDDILRAIEWLISGVPAREWAARMEHVRRTFESAKREWAAGGPAALFDDGDLIAWYVFQARAYAVERQDWFEPEAFRIAPVFRRLGEVLASLKEVNGAPERAARLMSEGRKQPDDGLFELLVAAAYKRRGWAGVTFVPELPGIAKTQDLLVSKPRTQWAVECKRVNRSGYEAAEKSSGEALAAPLHQLCRTANRSIVVEVIFHEELTRIDPEYLVDRAAMYLRNRRKNTWSDKVSQGHIRDIDWRLMRTVLAVDDIFFGSSRMVELLVGEYVPFADHSVAADWTPAEARPLHASAMKQASVVSWVSRSPAAAKRKARHFRAIVGQARRSASR